MNDEGADRGQEGIPAEPSVARRPAGPDRFSRAMLTVAALSLVALLAEVGYQTTTGFAMPFFLRGHLHLEMRVISLMTMCFLIAETGAKIPFGSLSDRYGRRRFVIMGPLISALAALAITTVPHPAMIAVLRAIDGIGAAMLWPTLFASVADVVDERRRATAMSLFNLMYIGGVVLGPLLYETVFRATQSDVMVFYVLAGFFVVAALLAWGVAPRPAAATVAEAVRPAEGHEAPTLSAWGIVWGQPILRAMLMVAVIQFVGLHMLNGVLSIYLNEDLGISKEMMGRVFLYVGIVVAVLAVPMGRLVDQMGKPEAIRLGLAVCAVGMWILPWVRSMPLLVMAAGIFGVGFLLASPAWLALMTELGGQERRGGVVGIMNTAQGVGAALGAAVSGSLYDYVGHWAPFVASALLFTVSVVIVFRQVRSPRAANT